MNIDIKLKSWTVKAESQAMTIAITPNTDHSVGLPLGVHWC